MSIEPTKPEHWPARAPFARSGSAMEMSRPTRVVARDGRSGIVVDPRVLAVRPELGDAEALVLDLALRAYDGTPDTVAVVKEQALRNVVTRAKAARGVRLVSDRIADLTGLTPQEAAAVIGSLVARRLLVEERDALGGADGWRPGPALTN